MRLSWCRFNSIMGIPMLIRRYLYTEMTPGYWQHDGVIKWKHFSRYWPFVRGIHRWPVDSPHKGQWRRALMFSLICAWTNGWANNRNAGELRRHRADFDVTVISLYICSSRSMFDRWGLFYKRFLANNSYLNRNLFCCHPNSKTWVITTFCIYHDICKLHILPKNTFDIHDVVWISSLPHQSRYFLANTSIEYLSLIPICDHMK